MESEGAKQLKMGEEELSGSSSAIDPSNIGFKLLKKHGWKEGTGLGVCEQGRLEPIKTYLKNNKRGLGADKVKKKIIEKPPDPECKNDNKEQIHPMISKAASKRMRKMLELEKKLRETEFERAFRRDFWPDNV